MQSLAALALVLGMIMLFRRPGPRVRRPPEENKPAPQSPEADIPPPTTPIIS